MTCPPWLHGLSECGEERRAHCGAESSLTCGKHTFMWSTCQDLGSVTRTEFPLRNNCPAWLHSRRLRPFQRGGAKWAIADCRSPQTRFCDRSGPAGNACFCRSSAKARNLPPQQPRGAQPDAVTGRDVRPSNFRDRVFERYGSIPQVKPTDPNRFGSFTAQNGAGAESAMGKGKESSAETQAHNISSCGCDAPRPVSSGRCAARSLPLVVHYARRAVGRVTLRADALVPVVVGRGRVLRLHRLQPRILPRRLVKMTGNADKSLTC